MKDATLVFPHQLFQDHPCVSKNREIHLIEDSLFFRDAKYPVKFHKKKLVFHRASMRAFEKFLVNKDFAPKYFEHVTIEKQDKNSGSMGIFFKKLNKKKIERVHITDPVDWALEKRVKLLTKKYNMELIINDSPGFLCDDEYIKSYFGETKKYLQTSFYIEQRKHLEILVEGKKSDKAVGGSWTYDTKNRKTIPKDLHIPQVPNLGMDSNPYVREAKKYVTRKFPDNYGEIEDFFYPIDFKSAQQWFKIFLTERFSQFGPYEDAMKKEVLLLFHSLLSPLLNVGLLTPKKVVADTLTFAKKNDVPLNSLEGFIRQIIGWREFMRAIYQLEGVTQRNSNHWNHLHKIPKSFYTGDTGVDPIDNVIKKLLKNAYLHHIERLMLLGNFMTLCEIDPTEIYKWFMELFIDAYDWVMVPNVYGMSTYADGGLITTKPYVSSSNYVRKMSDYKKGGWCEIWDALYWRFIHKHREAFKTNPRMSLMVRILDKKNKEDLEGLLQIANKYLMELHSK